MATKSLLTARYKRCTRTQLISLIKCYKAELKSIANAAEFKKFPGGRTQMQYAQAIKKQLRTVSIFLRNSTMQEINLKIKELRRQMAKKLGVSFSHARTRTAAVKKLEAKYNEIKNVKQISRLIAIVKGFKLSKFKNPKVTGALVKSSTTRKHTAKRKTMRKTTKRYAKAKRAGSTAKYRVESNKLKREIKSLKTRNASLRKLVAKFRQEAGKMQRHYSTLNRTAPRWTVVKGGAVGKDVSNIVRISNALTNALDSRKVG